MQSDVTPVCKGAGVDIDMGAELEPLAVLVLVWLVIVGRAALVDAGSVTGKRFSVPGRTRVILGGLTLCSGVMVAEAVSVSTTVTGQKGTSVIVYGSTDITVSLLEIPASSRLTSTEVVNAGQVTTDEAERG